MQAIYIVRIMIKNCVDPRNNNLIYTAQKFQDSKLRLMIKKCVYPSDYLKNFENSKVNNYQRKTISIAY